jgi:anti-sigma factor RsiW
MRFRRFLDAHVDGELDERLAPRVADHVASCPMCGGTAQFTVVLKRHLSLRRFLPSQVSRRASTESPR